MYVQGRNFISLWECPPPKKKIELIPPIIVRKQVKSEKKSYFL